MKNNKFNYYYFAVALSIGILVACGGETKKNDTDTVKVIDIAEPGEDTTARKLGFFDRTIKAYSKTNGKILAFVQSKYKNINNFAQTPNGLLFLAQNKPTTWIDGGKIDSKIRFGLISEKGEILLPNEYELISNPGMIADGYVEIKKDGKYGLYNYLTHEIINPEFDVIFPSPIMEYIAIGVKNDTYHKIYLDGKNKPFQDEKKVISYTQLFQSHPFNYTAEYYGTWYSTDSYAYTDNYSEMDDYQTITFTPASYIAQLDIYPTTANVYYGSDDSLALKISAIKNLSNNKQGFISNVFQRISDSRGYEENIQKLHIVSKSNKSIKNILLSNDSETYDMNGYSDAQRTAKFINDSIVEVKNFVSIQNKAIPYTNYTRYDFIEVTKSGNTKKLNRGLFPMTEVVELTKDHFKGAFIKFVTDSEERKQNPEYDEDWEEMEVICVTSHLTDKDLRYMLNEIYARHGLKFKNPELTNIFKQFSWYKPNYSNVDNNLSEIEKKNIDLILKIEKEVKLNPSKYIKRTYSYYVVAG